MTRRENRFMGKFTLIPDFRVYKTDPGMHLILVRAITFFLAGITLGLRHINVEFVLLITSHVCITHVVYRVVMNTRGWRYKVQLDLQMKKLKSELITLKFVQLQYGTFLSSLGVNQRPKHTRPD